MVRKFKFFHGIVSARRITAVWTPQLQEDLQERHGLDVESELTSLLSEQISREIDEDIMREMTRRINGGERSLDYLNRWINIGE
jgi:hypothetical protein